jgi:Raf kinase inhibitor-like YbhB/YbcL family protein
MKDTPALKKAISVVSIIFCTGASVAFAQTAAPLSLKSSAISEGAAVPKKYTGDGADVSPPLAWSTGPSGTKCYALSCEDPDAPSGTWWHWIIFNISPETTQLGENLAKTPTLAQGVLQGSNDFHKPGYNGPAPPAGKLHHYQFKVMALDSMLSLKADCNKDAFKKALKGHVLAEGQLTGVYQR